MEGPARLPRSLQLALFLRSLTLQASWNHQRMQNLGLLFTLLPWVRRRPPDVNLNRLFCRRYFEFFNTNPYLANYLVGGLLRLEDDRAAGRPVPPEMIPTYRDSLGRTFASLGDQLFWLGIRPALTMAACLLALAGRAHAVVALIVVFGLAQLVVRWTALQRGYRSGLDILGFLGHPAWHRGIRLAKRTGMVLTGMVAGSFVARVAGFAGGFGPDVVWLGVVLGIGLPLALRRRLPGEVMLLLALVLAVAVNFAI